MSRHPINAPASSHEQKLAEEYINYIAANAVPKAMTIQEVAEATKKDHTLQHVIKCLQYQKWRKDDNVDPFTYIQLRRLRTELSYLSDPGILLRNTRNVIPETLHHCSVDLAHAGHLGLVKTKSLLREKIWFPGVDKLVQDKVKNCISCQAVTPMPAREPLQMSKLPDAPWEELSADFAQLESGEYLLVVIDVYSRFPVVEIVNSTSASCVIPKLDKIFSEFGMPFMLRTDNGPPFQSEDFAKFAVTLGFTHQKVTPLWPGANGEVERFMKTIKKCVHIAQIEHQKWRRELVKFLCKYRVNLHSTTGVALATLLFSRNVHAKFPQLTTEPKNREEISQRDSEQKAKMKAYADDKSYVKPSSLQIGSRVLVKNSPSKGKKSAMFNPKPYTVIKIKGSMITAERHGHRITRNSSYFKEIQDQTNQNRDESVDEALTDNDTDSLMDFIYNPPGGNQLRREEEVVNAPVQQAAQPRRNPGRQRNLPKHLQDFVVIKNMNKGQNNP